MGLSLCKSNIKFEDGLTQQELPELNQKILKNLNQKKLFQNQLKKQNNKVIRKYNQGIYQGPLNIMDNPSGYGKFYFNNGCFYIGEFSNGKTKGQGALFQPDGSFMYGQFIQNQIKKGTFNCEKYTYNGQFKRNIFHGKGQFRSKLHNYQFIGIFQQGKKIKGKLHWTSEKCIYTYKGAFNQNQQFEGQGQLEQQPIGFYKGTFKNGLKNGKGRYQYNNGLKYIGDYQNGQKSGIGILYNGDDNSQAYNGNFFNGLPHGKGKAFGQKNVIIETNWIEGINQDQLKN